MPSRRRSQRPGYRQGRAIVAARTGHAGAQVVKRPGKRPDLAALDLIVTRECRLTLGKQRRRAEGDAQRRTGVLHVDHASGSGRSRSPAKPANVPPRLVHRDLGAERLIGVDGGLGVGGNQRRLDPAFAVGQRSDRHGADGMALGAGDVHGAAKFRTATNQVHRRIPYLKPILDDGSGGIVRFKLGHVQHVIGNGFVDRASLD